MNKKVAEALAEDIGPESSEIRTDSVVSRPGRTRAKVLQVRLNEDEFAALTKLAEAKGLPISTVARSMVLESLDLPKSVYAAEKSESTRDLVARTLVANIRLAEWLTEHEAA